MHIVRTFCAVFDASAAMRFDEVGVEVALRQDCPVPPVAMRTRSLMRRW